MRLHHELHTNALIPLMSQWCETSAAEEKRAAGVAYVDTSILYDDEATSEVCIKHVPASHTNNIYVFIPHPLCDPVVEGVRKRLTEFYRRTFWCNIAVFECCQAALALTKRGEITRCFIGRSPGGAGQSLYCLHLDAMLRHNHAFFDPNVWYQAPFPSPPRASGIPSE